MKGAHGIDMIGKRYGSLLVQARAPREPYTKPKWVCLCDCGRETTVIGYEMRAGKTKSCGCMKSARSSRLFTTHGRSGTPEYECWTGIKKRCLDPQNKHYRNYGGRGINICDRWKESFENFYEDMGQKPSPSHSIERRDNNEDYSPSNCHWATRSEQANNKRTTRYVEFQGRRMSLADACRLAGRPDRYYAIHQRLRAGSDFETALQEAGGNHG